MSPVDWYFARGNKQTGPISSADLKRLADAGEIRPDDLVWREGLTEWVLARNVRGLFDEEGKLPGVESPAKPAEAAPQTAEPITEKPTATKPAVQRIERRHPANVLLDGLRSLGKEQFLATTAAIFRACGVYGLGVAMTLIAAFAVIAAVKSEVLGNLLPGAATIILLAAMQYTAGLSCDALERLNRSVVVGLVSNALPNCVAILSLAAGTTTLLGAVGAAVPFSTYSAILVGMAVFVVSLYLALTALNVHVMVTTDGGTLGEEAIGVLALLAKCMMRLVPVVFGVGVIGGTLAMCYACYQMFAAGEGVLAASLMASAARWALIFSAALPLAAYLFFLLYGLIVDLCGAVLRVRGEGGKPTKSEEPKP